MKDEKLQISKKGGVKGEDGHKIFSIRIREDTVAALDQLAQKTNRSRNEIINILLDYSIPRCEIIDDNSAE